MLEQEEELKEQRQQIDKKLERKRQMTRGKRDKKYKK